VLIIGPFHTSNLVDTGMVMWEGFQRLSNSIRDVFPFILAPTSFTQKAPATCVNLLTDTLSETGELEKAIVSAGISPSHSSHEALATVKLHLRCVCNGHERNCWLIRFPGSYHKLWICKGRNSRWKFVTLLCVRLSNVYFQIL